MCLGFLYLLLLLEPFSVLLLFVPFQELNLLVVFSSIELKIQLREKIFFT